MVESGILACGGRMTEDACIVKLIECGISIVMLCLILLILVQRLRLECRCSFYLLVNLAMGCAILFIIAYTLNSDSKIFLFLAGYSYNVYFSIIVLKVGLKLISIIRHNIRYQRYRKIIIGTFVLYELCLVAALAYNVIEREEDCFAMPFLVSNLIGILAAIAFLMIGIKHSKEQEERLDLSLSKDKLRNPLPKFHCWILSNFIGQIMVLIESIIFQVNSCQFSNTEVVNDICRMAFEFLSFHLGIASTIYFFHLSNLTEEKERERTATVGNETPAHIELVYVENESEETRDKKESM